MTLRLAWAWGAPSEAPPMGPEMRMRPGIVITGCVSTLATTGVGDRSVRASIGVGTAVAGAPCPKNGVMTLSDADARVAIAPTCPRCALPVGLGWGALACNGATQKRSAGVGESVGRGVGVSHCGGLVCVGVAEATGDLWTAAPAVGPAGVEAAAVATVAGAVVPVGIIGVGVTNWAARASPLVEGLTATIASIHARAREVRAGDSGRRMAR